MQELDPVKLSEEQYLPAVHDSALARPMSMNRRIKRENMQARRGGGRALGKGGEGCWKRGDSLVLKVSLA